MFRVAAAALTFVLALLAGALYTAAVLPQPQESDGAAAVAQAADTGTSGDDGEWSTPPEAPVSTSESAWRSRAVPAAVASAPAPSHTPVVVPREPSRSRAPAPPVHFLQTPLLI